MNLASMDILAEAVEFDIVFVLVKCSVDQNDSLAELQIVNFGTSSRHKCPKGELWSFNH